MESKRYCSDRNDDGHSGSGKNCAGIFAQYRIGEFSVYYLHHRIR